MSLLDEITSKAGVSDVELRLERRRMALIQQITEELDRRGWTQARLADEMGKEDSQITRLLAPDSNPTLETLVEIEEALGRDLFTVNRNVKFRLREKGLAEVQMMISQASESEPQLAGTDQSYPEQGEEAGYDGGYEDVLRKLNLESGDNSGTD